MEIKYKPDEEHWEITVKPGEALLLIAYLGNKLVYGQQEPITFHTSQFKVTQPLPSLLEDSSLEDLQLRKDHVLALEAAGVKTLSILVSKTESQLMTHKGIKENRLKIYEEALNKLGLRLRGRNRFLDVNNLPGVRPPKSGPSKA